MMSLAMSLGSLARRAGQTLDVTAATCVALPLVIGMQRSANAQPQQVPESQYLRQAACDMPGRKMRAVSCTGLSVRLLQRLTIAAVSSCRMRFQLTLLSNGW